MRKYIVLLCITLILSQQSIFAQNLKITEVFVDGTDERIEVTNSWLDPFIWPLSIDGVKSTTLSIPSRTIPSLQSLIIGDTLSMITNLWSLTTLTNQWLSMTDTNAVNISLSSNSTPLDTFAVSQWQVQSYDNTKTSFMSLYTIGGQSRSIIPSFGSYNSNNSGWFTINPWVAYTDQWIFSSPIIVNTGSTGTWSTGTTVTIDCNTMQAGRIQVSEIHRGTIYTPYVEIISEQNWQGSLTLSGDGLTQPIVIPSRAWEENVRYLITATTSGLLHTSNVITIPGWWIQQTGVIALVKDSTTNIGYLLIDSTWHTLSSSISYQCLQGFDTLISPSPGFAQEFLGYANIQTVTQTVTTNCTTGNTNTWTWSWTGTTGTQINNYSRVVPWTVMISMVDYDPPGSDTNTERIGYLLTGSTWLNLSWRVLTYDGKTKTLGDIPLLPWVESIVTGNYTFVNSRPVCVSLSYIGNVIDTACYDPNDNPSPFIPWQWSGQISTWQNNTVWLDDDILSDAQFDVMSVVYDPPGSDTNNESVTIQMLGWSWTINLADLRLRIGTRNKTIYGTIVSWQTLTLIGNFQMSNSNATCVALVYNEHIYDEYCYNPSNPVNTNPTNNTETANLYGQRNINLSWIIYDPDGSDEWNESFILSMTGNQQSVDLTRLSIRINGSTRKRLSGILYDGIPLTMTGTRWLSNSRATCVDLVEWNHIFDTSCYDPLSWATEIDKVDTLSTWSSLTWWELALNNDILIDWLHLARILPNPIGKDTKWSEYIWLRREGEKLTIKNNKSIKIMIGKTSINLSGMILDNGIITLPASKALTNKAACVKLLFYEKRTKAWQERDSFCYPQTKEGVIYYHPGYKKETKSFSLETMKALSDDAIDLSHLILRKQNKNICLIYNKQTIRCMAGWWSSKSVQDKTKLANAYIRLASDLITNNDITTLRSLTRDYQTLNKALSDKKSSLTIQWYMIPVTDLERYHAIASIMSDEEKARESLARDIWWSDVVDDWYRLLRST